MGFMPDEDTNDPTDNGQIDFEVAFISKVDGEPFEATVKFGDSESPITRTVIEGMYDPHTDTTIIKVVADVNTPGDDVEDSTYEHFADHLLGVAALVRRAADKKNLD